MVFQYQPLLPQYRLGCCSQSTGFVWYWRRLWCSLCALSAVGGGEIGWEGSSRSKQPSPQKHHTPLIALEVKMINWQTNPKTVNSAMLNYKWKGDTGANIYIAFSKVPRPLPRLSMAVLLLKFSLVIKLSCTIYVNEKCQIFQRGKKIKKNVKIVKLVKSCHVL